MMEIGGHVEIRGPFSHQPRLVRFGFRLLFSASIVFGAYLPTSAAVAVIDTVGTPARDWRGTAGAIGLTAAMAAVGAWANARFLAFIRGEALTPFQWCFFNGICIATSAGVAALAVSLHVWPPVTAAALIATFANAIISALLIQLGNAFASRPRRK